MSPSKKVITAGQAGKFADVVIARLQKSGFPHEPTQHVLENEGVEIADVVEAEVRRRVEARIRANEPHILERKPFDLMQFIGKGWSIDERVGQRTGGNLDAGKIVRKDYLNKGESAINGEERLRRIKANPADIQLDGEDFLALYEEKDQLTLRWLYDTQNITWLSFWGIILRSPFGSRYVLCLCRRDGGSWGWDCYWVGNVSWVAGFPAVVLASLPAEASA